ncbi:hypothetical protein vBCbaSRXM_92 [Citromicrobium phage vB_CbaS-RXM]|nr:hypothetical protein vBCbaSRXM_92 [Citromicrobium phage vB_CbaS-RXM]
MSPSEIANQIVNSTDRTGPEGLSNREKLYFICDVFDVAGINLNDTFDYDAAIATQDCEIIQCAMFLASFQWEWATRCHLHGYATEQQQEEALAYLTLAKGKMAWAMTYLMVGREPPPYPFVN